MEKSAIIPTIVFNHITDTVITLPKSGKTISLNKNYSSSQIALLDSFLANNSASSQSIIQPNLSNCGTHSLQYWEVENTYQSIPTYKCLGIWTHSIDWTRLHDNYGFTRIFVDLNDDTLNARLAHFQHDSMMVNIPCSATQSYINDGGKAPYFYYYIDEPHSTCTNQNFLNLASWVYQKNPNGIFIFSDYWWPETNLLCYGHEGDGNTIQTYWFPNDRIRIMCDQYDGNGCGTAPDFWDEYKSYYGYGRNLTDWETLEPGHVNYWTSYLNFMSNTYRVNAWLYANDGGVTESILNDFCNTAWQTGWLLRLERFVTVFYKCTGDCTVCNWPAGTWTSYAWNYGASQWVHY